MASLSNINGLFDVHSTGAILFSTSHGTSGQILKSNGNAAPTWIPQSDIVGAYLPLAGGTLTGATATASGISFSVGGALSAGVTTITSDTGLNIYTSTNGVGAEIAFSDVGARSQKGFITYFHADSASYGSANSFVITGDQTTMTILADGKLMYKEGVYLKPATGTGGGTRKDNLWDAAYNDKITGLAVTGTTTKTLTATQQDGGTLTATWTDNDSGGTVTGTGANTQVAFWTGTSVIDGSSDLRWDNTNKELGIGRNPDYPLDVYKSSSTSGTATGTTMQRLWNYVGADLSQQKTFIDFVFQDDNDNEYPQVRIGAEVGQNGDANSTIKEGSGAFVVYTNNATGSTPGTNSLTERMRVDYAGNVGINDTSPSHKLSVVGTANFTGLVSGITPTAAANFATKAYVDAHPGSGGTVTSVATGNGLTGGTITTTGTLSLDRPNSQLGAVLATYGTTAGASGRIRCTAPFNTNTGKMFSIEITLYGSYTQHNYVVSAYMYSTTNQWYSPKAIYTTTGTATPDIIVGRDANGKAYISIANANYTGVLVHNMTRGYQTSLADTYDPWTIAVNAGTENSVGVSTSQVWTTANHTPGNYLPLSGGTLTGALTGTSATFSGFTTSATGFGINYVSGGTVPMVILANATTYGIFYREASPDHIEFKHGGTVRQSFDGNGNVSITGDFTVSGGDITLGGTGRIQGVDTVTDSTDAANKAYVDAHPGSGGTVTSVATGSGLTGGTITSTGTLSVDSTVIRTTGNQSITGNTTFYPSSTSTGYSTAAIELMASSSGTSGTPPRISWHWGGVVASSITIEANGTIAVRNNPGNAYEQFKASVITATSNFSGNLTGNVTGNVTGSSGSCTGNSATATLATTATMANAVANTGYGGGTSFTFYQSSGSFSGYSGWHNYYIGNHGNGSNYYNTIIAIPFWGSPRYSRLEGGVQRGPFEFWTSERTIVSTHDVTAPRYYDTNTTYYGDFASTSNINALTLVGTLSGQNGYFLQDVGIGFNSGNIGGKLNIQINSANGIGIKNNLNGKSGAQGLLQYTSASYASGGYNMVFQAVPPSGSDTNMLLCYLNGNIVNRFNSYGQYSDRKLKENIVDTTPKLEDVKKIRIRNFNFKDDPYKQIGVIAQEFEEVFPGLVEDKEVPDQDETTKTVKYSVLVPILVKAIQELEARVKELENK